MALVVLLAVVGAACADDAATGPPAISYGRDVCTECHMIISEPRYAAAYRTESGEPFAFDDIGDLLRHATRTGAADGMTAWVHDYRTEDWLDARNAWFVRSAETETPMGGGIVAFRRRNDAERFLAERGGELLRWPALVEDAASRAGSGDSEEPETTER